MNPLIAVIADDLTGVCDTGAQFAAAGLRTVGSVDGRFRSRDIPQVVLVNTQSRSSGPGDAPLIVQRAAAGLREFGPKWFFKKIDTALRGHIAAEVVAMMETLGVNTALYAASIPGAGRTTVNGCQFFRGVPIKESIHGEDRLNPNPISTSSNVELFSKVPFLETGVVSLKEVRSGKLEISGRITGPSKKVIILDSETDEDLDRIVRASMTVESSSFIYVGSFGLSSALGRYLAESLRMTKGQEQTASGKTLSFDKKRALIVSGSSHPMARSQISYLDRRGLIEIVPFEPEDLTGDLGSCIARAGHAFQSAMDHQKRMALIIGEGRSGARRQSQELVMALAKIVRSLLDADGAGALVLIGGETGYEVCRAAGIEGIEILGNISFVAAYGRPEGSRSRVRLLATKGGSLGEEDTLEKILNFIDLRASQ
jgi:uncharacterized protein YgbK (DUF1537 family)